MSAPWLKQALIGVDGTPTLPLDGVLGPLLAQIVDQGDDAALAFGRAAGAMAACRLAAVTFVPDETPLPSPAAHDAHALGEDHAWTSMLARTFAEGPMRLQYEACLRLAAVPAMVPTQLLPQALDAGRRSQV